MPEPSAGSVPAPPGLMLVGLLGGLARRRGHQWPAWSTCVDSSCFLIALRRAGGVDCGAGRIGSACLTAMTAAVRPRSRDGDALIDIVVRPGRRRCGRPQRRSHPVGRSAARIGLGSIGPARSNTGTCSCSPWRTTWQNGDRGRGSFARTAQIEPSLFDPRRLGALTLQRYSPQGSQSTCVANYAIPRRSRPEPQDTRRAPMAERSNIRTRGRGRAVRPRR